MHVVQTGTFLDRASAVCVKWVNNAGDKEVSIAANDSCGAMSVMGRCNIRCYAGPSLAADVTEQVLGPDACHDASNANLRKALEWLGD